MRVEIRSYLLILSSLSNARFSTSLQFSRAQPTICQSVAWRTPSVRHPSDHKVQVSTLAFCCRRLIAHSADDVIRRRHLYHPRHARPLLLTLLFQRQRACQVLLWHFYWTLSCGSLFWSRWVLMRKLVSWSLTSLFSTNMAISETVTVYRGHRRALCFPARDYLLGHHVHRNYLK